MKLAVVSPTSIKTTLATSSVQNAQKTGSLATNVYHSFMLLMASAESLSAHSYATNVKTTDKPVLNVRAGSTLLTTSANPIGCHSILQIVQLDAKSAKEAINAPSALRITSSKRVNASAEEI